MRPCGPSSAADTVPGSPLIACQLGGYASAAVCDGSRATLQPEGRAVGSSQPNAPFGRTVRSTRELPAPPQPAIARAAASAAASHRRLGIAVAIARSAVVVGVVVAAIVLRDATVVAMVVMMVSGRVLRGVHGRAVAMGDPGDRDRQHGREREHTSDELAGARGHCADTFFG